jgi:hypothetical protein
VLTEQYASNHHGVEWHGYNVNNNAIYQDFMENNVRARLNDTEGQATVESHLRSLVSTRFETENLETLLNARAQEERDWAVGESFSEALLEQEIGAIFPWNHSRDLRNENASSAGADIVGFINDDGQYKLLLGEVKTSEENCYPPQVVTARHGIANQLEALGTNTTRLMTLINWLLPRCKGTAFEVNFDESVKYLLSSPSNQGMYLVGVLVRPNITANENDLQSRGTSLGNTFNGTITKALLLACYLPHSLADFASLAIGGDQ